MSLINFVFPSFPSFQHYKESISGTNNLPSHVNLEEQPTDHGAPTTGGGAPITNQTRGWRPPPRQRRKRSDCHRTWWNYKFDRDVWSTISKQRMRLDTTKMTSNDTSDDDGCEKNRTPKEKIAANYCCVSRKSCNFQKSTNGLNTLQSPAEWRSNRKATKKIMQQLLKTKKKIMQQLLYMLTPMALSSNVSIVITR